MCAAATPRLWRASVSALAIDRGAQAEDRFEALFGCQRHRDLDRRARVQAGTHAPGQTLPRERGRCGQAAIAPEELIAVGGDAAVGCIGIEERHAPVELGVVWIARGEHAAAQVDLADHMQLRARADVAQHPFHVASDAEPAWTAGKILQPQMAELDRPLHIHEHPQLAADAVFDMAVDAVAEAVAHRVAATAAAWQRHRRPHLPGVFVAQVERLAGGIADRIVMPGREPEFVRVFGPAIAGAAVADHAAELRIGHHVAPRRRCCDAFVQGDAVLAAVGGEGTQAVVEQHRFFGGSLQGLVQVRGMRAGQFIGAVRLPHRLQQRRLRTRAGVALQLRIQRAVGIAQNRPCHGLQQHAVFLRDVLDGAHEDTAGAVEHIGLGVGGDQAQDGVLQLLAIAGLAFVPDHQIRTQAFQAPVRVRLHQLAHQVQIVRVGDAQQHDRQVAGDGMTPQRRLAAMVVQQHLVVGAQLRVDEQHACGQPLVEHGVFQRGVDLPAGDLALGQRQIEYAVGQTAVAVFVDQGGAGGTLGAHAVDHVHLRLLIRRQRDAAADRHDRVQHRAGRAGQAGLIAQGQRIAGAASAPDERGAVGLVGDRRHIGIVHRHQMQHPRLRFVVPARAPRAQQCLLVGQDFGLHEQIAESRMRLVGLRRRQHHFGVGGDFDHPRLPRTVTDAQPAQLHIVLGGNGDFQMAVVALVAALELGLGVGKDRFVTLHRHAGRLMRGRPHRAAVHITQIAERAPVVAGAVFAPTRHRHVARAAVAATCGGQHAVVTPVGEQLQRRLRQVGVAMDAQRHTRLGGHRALGCFDQAFDVDAGTRCALLQQQ